MSFPDVSSMEVVMNNAAMKYSLTSTCVDRYFIFFFLRRVPGVKWLSHVIRVCLPITHCFPKQLDRFSLLFFRLGWVFVAVHGLSLVVESRGYFLVGV